MKAKDLFIPLSSENRVPIVVKRLLYIPKFFSNHSDFTQTSYFDNDNDIQLEYCSGNGQWIVEKAKLNPNKNFFAVEMKFERARKIWAKVHNEKLNNLFVIMGEAFTFTKHYLKENEISEIFINFPDPWPKKRHEKNRLINKEFIIEIERILKKDGIINLVTDDESYRNQMINLFTDQTKESKFKSLYQNPYFVQNLENFGESYFNELFRKKGININYMKFQKIN